MGQGPPRKHTRKTLPSKKFRRNLIQDNSAKLTLILKIPKPEPIYMTPGVFLRVILISMIHQEPPVLHRSNQENLVKSSPILKIPKPKHIYMTSGVFLSVILMSMIHQEPPVLHRSNQENLVKSSPILKIPKPKTIYMASGIFLDVILTSMTPSGTIRNVHMLQGS